MSILHEMLRFGGGRVRDSMWDSGPGGMNGAGLRMLASAIIYKKAPVGAMFLDGKDKMGNFEPFEYKTRRPEQFRWVVWWSRKKKKDRHGRPHRVLACKEWHMPTISTLF